MALWLPLDLGAKLYRWWSSLDSATITQSGGAVSQWNDKSGNADNAVGVGTQQPAYNATGLPGGTPALVCDGGDDVLNHLGPTYNGTSGFEFLAIVQNDGNATYRTIFSGQDGSATLRLNNNQTVGLIRTNIAEVQNSTGTVGTGVHGIGASVSSGTSTIFIDGTSAGVQSTVDPAFTVAQTLLFMNGGSSSPFSGAAGDLYLCQKLTLAERQKLEGYAFHARGIQSLLPVGHPNRTSPPTTDAPKTFYLKAATASGSNMGSLQDGGTAPTRVGNTGWNVGANPTSTPFALMAYGTIVPRANFVASSPQALGSGPVNTAGAASAWRSETAYTGSFAATQWAMAFAIRSTNGTAQRGNIKVRVWASTDPTGQTNKRELTPGFAFQGNALTTISLATDNITSTEWTPDAVINLVNEYLFIDCEWRITTAGANTAAALVISDGAASTIVTSAFQASAGSAGAAAGVATAAATGAATAGASGAPAGIATVAGTGASTARASGASAGTGTAAATGLGTSRAAGSSVGTATGAATGAAKGSAGGTAAGTATASATGASTARAAGTAAGAATASAQAGGGSSAVGTTAGIGTASAVGRATSAATGASAGAATASGTGAAATAAAGVSPGVATAAATGSSVSAGGSVRARNYVVVGVPGLTLATGLAGGTRSRNYVVSGVPVLSLGAAQGAVGSAAGSSTAAAVGRSTVAATGSAAGTSTVTATGAAVTAATGSAPGAATAAGQGAALARAAGSAAGAATGAGVGAGLAAATGSAAGTATAAGNAPGGAAGSAAGTATAAGVGRALVAATGAAAGAATAAGDASQLASGAGSAAGTATAAAVGTTLRLASGTAAGTATAAGVGRGLREAAGVAAGASTANGVGRATARSAGAAAGTSTATGAARGQGWGVIVRPAGVWTVIPPPGGEWDEAA